ncbi:spore coat protein YsxE [Neobacillus sp. D3-1R]|uniref:spore coat protein YsxE n=1 Tax=Neobacillus sp. D3-1R TaxID=3445778 RepID=UPI003FA05FCA
MNEHTVFQELNPVLKHYDIRTSFIEKFGKIYKIYSNKGTFALKQIPVHHGIDFIRQVQYLYQRGFNRIVPIYPSLDGRYAILHQNSLYYLMPWLANDEKEDRSKRPQQMFRELARMHTLSQKELTVNKEERTEHYENTKQQWDKEAELLEGFVETCEKKVYMSPFELQFCLYFQETKMAQQFALKKLEEWYEATKDLEKARSVINHGKVSMEHFLLDENGYGYFSNFENAKLGSPIHDVLPVLHRALKGQPRQSEEAITWLYDGYFKYFPFKEEEKHLFFSYFAYPTPMIRLIKEYIQVKGKKNEFKFSKRLQRKYWHMKNTEYVVMRMTEIEMKAKQQKEGAPE